MSGTNLSYEITHTKSLQQIVEVINDFVNTEKIFLLPQQPYEFLLPVPQELPKYHLLVLSRERVPIDISRMEELVEINCTEKTIISITAIDFPFFHFRYSQQQYFFPELEKSSLVYDFSHRPLACRPIPDIPGIQRFLRNSFHLHMAKAEELFRMAKTAWLNGVMNLQILSECTRYIFHAIEVVFTGFNSDTHNLLWLRRSIARFSSELAGLFPCHSEKEKMLLYRLHQLSANKPLKAKIPLTELIYTGALERVEDMLMIANLVCSTHINELPGT